MKKIYLFLTGAIVIGAMVVGAPFICGKHIEDLVNTLGLDVDKDNYNIISYERGIFQSKSVLRIKTPLMNKSFLTKMTVAHGPIIFNGVNKFGLGSIVHEIDNDETVFLGNTFVNFNGTLTYNLTTPTITIAVRELELPSNVSVDLKLKASSLRFWAGLFSGFFDIEDDFVNKLERALPELAQDGFLIAKKQVYKTSINWNLKKGKYTVNAQELTEARLEKIFTILNSEQEGLVKKSDTILIPLNELDTKLLRAMDKHDFKTAAALIDKGANVDLYSDNNFHTPLFLAARNGDYKAVKFLVEHGADIDAVDDSNRNALSWAARKNRIKAIEYLLENNANTSFKRNISDKTAYDMAAENFFHDAAVLIANAMVRQGLKDPR